MRHAGKHNVYLATKLSTGKLLAAMFSEYKKVHITSTWLEFVGVVEDSPDNAKVFWQRDFEDIDKSDFVVVWAESDSHKLRGALVEVGYAIAKGIPVIVIGDHPDYGTWQHGIAIYKASSVASAVWMMEHLRRKG